MSRATQMPLLVLIVVTSMLAACVTPATSVTAPADHTPTRNPAPGTSGILGQVLIGPTCPGPVKVGDQNCADKPYQAEIIVLDTRGVEVSRSTSDTEGAFRFDLAPGRYVLHPVSGNPLPIASDQEIEVKDGSHTTVVVNFDSGIR